VQKYSRKKRAVFTAIAVLLLLTVTAGGVAGVYLYSILPKTRSFYRHLKHRERGLRGHIYLPDPALGFVPMPEANGAEILPAGLEVPIRCDENGLRVPESYRSERPGRPLLLSLGCSFTFGAAVPEEDTFTEQAGEILGWNTANGGVCSYGLTQMLLRGRELIPRLKPDVVLVQWSPWLLERAKRMLGPLDFLSVAPIPYFYNTPEGLKIHKPVFLGAVFYLPLEDYRGGKPQKREFISFLLRGALPLYLHDDWNMLLLKLKKRLGIVPEPGGDDEEIQRAVYGEISRLARANGGKAYILNLPWGEEPQPCPDGIARLGIPVIDVQPKLLEKLPSRCRSRREAFAQLFSIYRGNPPRCIDKHPNSRAHRLMAEEIARVLSEDFAAESKPENP